MCFQVGKDSIFASLSVLSTKWRRFLFFYPFRKSTMTNMIYHKCTMVNIILYHGIKCCSILVPKCFCRLPNIKHNWCSPWSCMKLLWLAIGTIDGWCGLYHGNSCFIRWCLFMANNLNHCSFSYTLDLLGISLQNMRVKITRAYWYIYNTTSNT